jgi:hypothetical protein
MEIKMPIKTKPEDASTPETLNVRDQPNSQDSIPKKPSLGFQLVALGLVAYILHAAKLLTFSWLFPVALMLILIGFVMLILGALAKRL